MSENPADDIFESEPTEVIEQSGQGKTAGHDALRRRHDFYRIKGTIAEVNPLNDDGDRYADEYLVNLYEKGYNERQTRQIRAYNLNPVDCFVPNEEVDILYTADGISYIFKTSGHMVGTVECNGPNGEEDYTDNRYWVWVHRVQDDGSNNPITLIPHYSEDVNDLGKKDIITVINLDEENQKTHYVKPDTKVYFFRHSTVGVQPKYIAISMDQNLTGRECSSSSSSSEGSSEGSSGSEESGSSEEILNYCYTTYAIIWNCDEGGGWGTWRLVETKCLESPPRGTWGDDPAITEYPLDQLFKKNSLVVDGKEIECQYWYIYSTPRCTDDASCGANYPGTPSVALPENPSDCCGSESSSEGSSSGSESSSEGSSSGSEGSGSSGSGSGGPGGDCNCEWGEIRWNDSTKTIEQYNNFTMLWVEKVWFAPCKDASGSGS